MDKLSSKEQRFVSEYLKDQNATQAAVRAGYSKKTAHVQGPRLLGKVRVRAAVDAALAKVGAKCELTAEKVYRAISSVLDFDPRAAYHADGTLKDVSALPDSVALAIAGIETDDENGSVKKLKFADRTRAAELAAKLLRLMPPLEVSGRGGAPLFPPPVTINFSKINDVTLRKVAGMKNGNGSHPNGVHANGDAHG